MEDDKLYTFSKQLEKEVETIIYSMKKFHELWINTIYSDFNNNGFEVFKNQENLHVSIYCDWKAKSDISQSIRQNIARVLRELKIAKALKTVDSDIITEVNQEIQIILRYITDFIAVVDKHKLEHLIEKFQKQINKSKTKLQKKSAEARQTRKEKPSEASPLTNMIKTLASNLSCKIVPDISSKIFQERKHSDHNTEAPEEKLSSVRNTSAPKRKVTDDTRIDEYNKLIDDLSILSDYSIKMNIIFNSSCNTIKEMISSVINENAEAINSGHVSSMTVQVENMTKMTQCVNNFFEVIQSITSENERITRTVVLKCSPQFLIDQ